MHYIFCTKNMKPNKILFVGAPTDKKISEVESVVTLQLLRREKCSCNCLSSV